MPVTRPHASAAGPSGLIAAPRTDAAAPSPAARDLGDEQRRWEADLPAVTAAIATLTRPLELCDRSTATKSQWYHHSPDLELSIDITAQAAGAATEVDGGLTIEDFAEATGIALPDGDYETAAGYVIARLGRLPAVGDGVDVGPARLTVAEMEGRRVTRLTISAAATDSDPSD